MAIRDTGRVLNQLLETAKHCKVMRLHPPRRSSRGAQPLSMMNIEVPSKNYFGRWIRCVDLHLAVVLQCSVRHSVCVTLGMEYIYCPGGMCYISAVGLSCLSPRSGGIKRSDVISRQVSVN